MLLVSNLANTKLREKLKNDWDPGTCELIWEYSARAFQWIPIWQGLDGFQKYLHYCALAKVALSLEGLTNSDLEYPTFHWNNSRKGRFSQFSWLRYSDLFIQAMQLYMFQVLVPAAKFQAFGSYIGKKP